MDYRERWELKDYLIGQTLVRRIVLFQVLLAALCLGFLLKFWYLQVVRGDEYASLAENNRLRQIPMPPQRGLIIDRAGHVIAATRASLSLVLMREGAQELDSQLRRLEPVLDTSGEELAARVDRSRHRPLFEPLVLEDDVSLEQLAWIEARREQFRSLEVQQQPRRSYPHGDAFAHVIGYVGEASEAQLEAEGSQLHLGDIVGKAGVERYYDDHLRGVRGFSLVSVNALGRRMDSGRIGREPEHGEPLQLTLHAGMQSALREGLGEEAGAGVFLDPWTGQVLALASTPSYDPNRFASGISGAEWRAISGDPRRPLHDRALASFYAPGSTFKVLMAIAGLETGKISADTTVHCAGSTSIYGHRRLCWKKGGHGAVDLRRALTHSCNVYFYHLGQRLGIDPIHEYGTRFNLGRRTGIDLPGEVAGILGNDAWKRKTMREPWYPGDTISVAIGQGLLAVTPVQMATFISGVATGGLVPRPHLVVDRRPEPSFVDVDPETMRLVRQALRDAVHLGTGRRADIPEVGVAGKTGTAQVYKHSAGIDADELPKEERDHAWFVGFAPHDRPRVAFAVVVEHGGHGGTTAAPITRRVLEVFFSDPAMRGGPPDDRRAAVAPAGEPEDVRPAPAG